MLGAFQDAAAIGQEYHHRLILITGRLLSHGNDGRLRYIAVYHRALAQ